MLAADGEVRVERVVLEHHRDVAALRRVVADVALADVDRAGVDLLEPGEHPQRGRLAGARRADEHHQLAVGDLEVERVDRRLVVAGIGPRRLHVAHLSHGPPPPRVRLRARASASGPAPSSSSPSSAAPTIGSEAATRSSHLRPEAGLDRAQQAPVAGPEHPAAEQHLDGGAAELEPLDRGVHEREHLGGEPLDDRGRDRVGRGGVEHQRRQLDDPPLRHAAEVDRLDELAGRGEAEVLGHRALEPRARAAAVLAAHRRRQRGEADVVAAAPVAADRAERGEAHVAAVGADADAVDAGAAHHRDAPAALGAGAQDGERVVADAQALGPAAVDRGVQPLLLDRQVEPGQQQVADRGARVAVEPRACARARVQLLEHRDRSRRARGGGAS